MGSSCVKQQPPSQKPKVVKLLKTPTKVLNPHINSQSYYNYHRIIKPNDKCRTCRKNPDLKYDVNFMKGIYCKYRFMCSCTFN